MSVEIDQHWDLCSVACTHEGREKEAFGRSRRDQRAHVAEASKRKFSARASGQAEAVLQLGWE